MKNNPQHKKWLTDLGLDRPLVIAGPCSAETEQQVMRIAHDLKDANISFFRSGIWKPRTRPGNFEGVGAIGLKWLQRVKAETGIPTAIEVANRTHVELALKHDIDLLWIGARSTVSPFIVQEIADALEGTDKIVLVKNPVNPDLSLWIGAVERLHHANIKNLGVIHRGFSTYAKTKYRNNPEWQIAVDFQRQFPDIPLIVDPSHITGKRDMIFDVSQTALELNYDGLMIETHCTPDEAWSDAAQQVTPAQLKSILSNLRVPNPSDHTEEYLAELSQLRHKIDALDNSLIRILGQRMALADDIGRLKKDRNVSILQIQRWNHILETMRKTGRAEDLSEDFIQRVFKAIHD